MEPVGIIVAQFLPARQTEQIKMPFALVTIGLLMIVTGAKDTYAQFGSQIVKDFTGANNFTFWIVGLGSVGALGYIEQFRIFSRLFMTLIIIVMLLKNGGFFDQFTAALQSGPVAPEKSTAKAETAGGIDYSNPISVFNKDWNMSDALNYSVAGSATRSRNYLQNLGTTVDVFKKIGSFFGF
jgi:hypothetical protein